MKINKSSSVVVDLSEDLALGDTVLRIGALKIMQGNCREFYVISHRADALRTAGIRNVITYSDIAELLPSIDFAVRPPSWMAGSKDFWSNIPSNKHKVSFIDGLLDCRHDYDLEEIRKNPRFFSPDKSIINRVSRNFVRQLEKFTEFDINPYDVVQGISQKCDIGARDLDSSSGGLNPPSADFSLSSENVLAIADSSSNSTKSWPYYEGLVNRLSAAYPNLKYAFIAKDTIFDSKKILSLNHPERVIYSAARDDISESWDILRKCFAFVGNDSGPAHYYSMVHSGKRPMLVLFYAKNDPSRWMPFSITSDFLYVDSSGKLIDKSHYDYLDWQKDYDSASFSNMREIGIESVKEKLVALIR